RIFSLQLSQFFPGVVSGFRRSLRQSLILHEFDIRQCGSAGDRVASEGGEMVSRFVCGRDLGARGEGAEWKSVGDAFGGDENVWGDAVMLDGKHLARAGEAGLDFVGDEQNFVLV